MPDKALVGVAESIELHAHAIHQREVEAAQLAVLVAGVGVVEHAAGLERPAQRAGGQHRHLVLSCWLPDHMFDMNTRQELSSTVPSPSGIAASLSIR